MPVSEKKKKKKKEISEEPQEQKKLQAIKWLHNRRYYDFEKIDSICDEIATAFSERSTIHSEESVEIIDPRIKIDAENMIEIPSKPPIQEISSALSCSFQNLNSLSSENEELTHHSLAHNSLLTSPKAKIECIGEYSIDDRSKSESESTEKIPILYSFQYKDPNDIKHILQAIIQKDESRKTVPSVEDIEVDLEVDQVQRIQNIYNWRKTIMARFT